MITGSNMKRSKLTPKKSLTTKSVLKRGTIKSKKPLKSKSTLIKTADVWFSRYIRLRDSEFIAGRWVGRCITCKRKHVVCIDGKFQRGVNAGHFVSRGHKLLRFDEENVNMQCVYCNKWRQGEILKYRVALDEKYGEGTADKLDTLSKQLHILGRAELEEIIRDSKTRVAYYLQMC